MHYVYRIALSGLLCITPLMHSMQKPTFHVNVKSNFKDIFLFGMGIAIGAGLTFTYSTFYVNEKVVSYIKKQGKCIEAQRRALMKQKRELLKQERELVRAGLRGKLPFFTVEPNGSMVRTAINLNSSKVDDFFRKTYEATKEL
jgi:hypothetical protein